ncbi:MAG TPA: Lpg1974 family pore-forming outer membrane protein, partial [Rhabdochlamydiaceae bacterium]
MKKLSLAFLVVASALVADDPCSLRNGYNPVVKDGDNIWIDVGILYWQPWERALVATTKKSDVFTTDNFTESPVILPHFNWDLGYRVSAGYLFASNLWDVEGSWTDFSSHVSQHRSSNGSPSLGMFPIWSLSDDVIAGDYVFESDLKWKFSVNMLDVQFGRYARVFHRLDLNPFIGMRSAWIKQGGDIVYEGGMFLIGILQPGISLYGTDFIKMKNNYWGFGPRAGIAPRFILGKGFSLNADAAISGLYGFFKIRQKETYLDTTR